MLCKRHGSSTAWRHDQFRANMTGFDYLLVLANGEPGDPGVFVVNEPPGAWKVGDVFFTGTGDWFRILALEGAPEGTVAEAQEWNAVWTVEPV
jgi:hypothetical protein